MWWLAEAPNLTLFSVMRIRMFQLRVLLTGADLIASKLIEVRTTETLGECDPG